MALKDALKTPPVVRTGVRSRIDVWRDTLDASERKVFDDAVRNPAWPTSHLVNIVNGEGLDISDGAFRDWRRRVLRASA